MSRPSTQQGPLRSWQTKESRHYCAICNAWMGNDRQSILTHENGRKHKENVAKSLKDKRDNQKKEDKQAAALKSALRAMEGAAVASMATSTDSLYYDTSNLASMVSGAPQQPPMYASAIPPPPPSSQPKDNKNKRKEMTDWNARKKQRQDEKKKKKDGDEEEPDDAPSSSAPQQSQQERKTIGLNEGHYSSNDNDKTYLEATTFYEILEEDMPIQIWTGSNLATAEEKKLAHHDDLWMNGLVVAIRKRQATVEDTDPKVLDVAYLKNATDQDETLEKGVRLHRIRIVLGSDESIPQTLEEARILAMGGEEIHVNNDNNATMDEATGLTGWSTVTIKRTTVHQQAREERAKQRQLERAAKRAAEEAAKQAQTRKMEESKVENAEDSALGAFDVWSQTGKTGYKGVDIHAEANVSVHDTGKKLAAKGETVAFKKSKFKKKEKQSKKNVRR